ncbi:MAG TPA: TIGR01212 family radical SAM protein [Desulfobacteraceae bacterium]|nr:TIGR01212 family radical SAM protein [Desulfobacteraceae bacterium]HPJ67921.1 TIGR01212 family radical SAM protein [Desulfobacteraceae bacterium]HPQ29116.1 TIGR01212 family radical SAM protein [Desulfobacteraceae bacterium]
MLSLKRYRDFNHYLKDIFGERVQKIPLDAGLNCPNRDGTISSEGCIFCDGRGSGTGALINKGLSIDEQIANAKKFLKKRYKAKKFIAYFQSFSNTYAPVSRLKTLYDQALLHDDVVGLSIATRPDCVNEDIFKLLNSYRNNRLVWIEFGLQSAHDKTLALINRGHDAACFSQSVLAAHAHELKVCAHVILGLPGETREMIMQTARFVSELPVQGIKIHLLYVVKGTRLACLYNKGEFDCLDQNTYVELVTEFLELLPPDMVIQRLTGDPVKSELLAPSWARDKAKTLIMINEMLEKKSSWQGKLYNKQKAQ